MIQITICFAKPTHIVSICNRQWKARGPFRRSLLENIIPKMKRVYL